MAGMAHMVGLKSADRWEHLLYVKLLSSTQINCVLFIDILFLNKTFRNIKSVVPYYYLHILQPFPESSNFSCSVHSPL